MVLSLFFFHHPATTAFYTLSLHDALPIFRPRHRSSRRAAADRAFAVPTAAVRSVDAGGGGRAPDSRDRHAGGGRARGDRKSTRLNSSHSQISYAVFCLKKKTTKHKNKQHP